MHMRCIFQCEWSRRMERFDWWKYIFHPFSTRPASAFRVQDCIQVLRFGTPQAAVCWWIGFGEATIRTWAFRPCVCTRRSAKPNGGFPPEPDRILANHTDKPYGLTLSSHYVLVQWALNKEGGAGYLRTGLRRSNRRTAEDTESR